MSLHIPKQIRYTVTPDQQRRYNVGASIIKSMAETVPQVHPGDFSLNVVGREGALGFAQVAIQALLPECLISVSEQIGAGSFGQVYAAEAKQCGDQVASIDLALKVAQEGAIHDNEDKFLNLFNGHPHGVTYYGSYRDGAGQVIAMGRETSSLEDQPYDPKNVAQLVAILELLEKEKVLHRDLKPANLLLGQDGNLKLADLGAATVVPDQCNYWCKVSLADGEYTPAFLDPNRHAAARTVLASGWELYDMDHFATGVSLLTMFWGSIYPIFLLCGMVVTGSEDVDYLGEWLSIETNQEVCISKKLPDRGFWDDAIGILQRIGGEEEQLFSSFLWGTASSRPSRAEYRAQLKAYVERETLDSDQ